MPHPHQLGWKVKGHPLLWLAVLAPTSLFTVWDAVAFPVRAVQGTGAMEPAARAEFMSVLIGQSLAHAAAGVVMGYYAVKVGRLCWKMYAPRPLRPPGHCRRCGYDLTGNVSGTCPECGRSVRSLIAPAGRLPSSSPLRSPG